MKRTPIFVSSFRASSKPLEPFLVLELEPVVPVLSSSSEIDFEPIPKSAVGAVVGAVAPEP